VFPRKQCFHGGSVERAVLDFYYISPGDIHLAQIKKRSDVPLEPVVRVVISSPLLYEFLEMCKPLAEKFTLGLSEEER